ncbi:MAG: YtxH domain-containing protein [Candidatus Sulfotelmatobacter sp.]
MRFGRYESSEENSTLGTAITFFLIGLGAGALTALVLTPKTGKQFRRDLKRGYDDAKDKIEDWVEDAAEEAKDRVREVKERVRDAAERGADLADGLREKVEPLRRVINRG